MIGEIDSRGYDYDGRITLLPKKKSLRFRPTAAMGSYLGGELETSCGSLEELRSFLRTCSYVSDPEQFGVSDYWAHPRDFEATRKGDCDCFALWTWRQLVELGYDARFVVGWAGYGRRSHAWVTYQADGRRYLVEPTAARWAKLPRLVTMMYEPAASVSWTGKESVAIAAEWVPLFIFRGFVWILRWALYWLSLPVRYLKTGRDPGP